MGLYLSEEIAQGKTHPFVCPLPGCGREMHAAEVHALLSPLGGGAAAGEVGVGVGGVGGGGGGGSGGAEHALAHLRRNERQRMVADDAALRFCPAPGCGEVCRLVPSGLLGHGNAAVHCPSPACGLVSCAKCGAREHPFRRCASAGEAALDAWRSARAAAGDDAPDVKQCPRCAAALEKSSGCNHMTCANCAHQFCWLCMRTYTFDHYTSRWGCTGQHMGEHTASRWGGTAAMQAFNRRVVGTVAGAAGLAAVGTAAVVGVAAAALAVPAVPLVMAAEKAQSARRRWQAEHDPFGAAAMANSSEQPSALDRAAVSLLNRAGRATHFAMEFKDGVHSMFQ